MTQLLFSLCAFGIFPRPHHYRLTHCLSKVQILEREKLIGPVWIGPDWMIRDHHPGSTELS